MRTGFVDQHVPVIGLFLDNSVGAGFSIHPDEVSFDAEFIQAVFESFTGSPSHPTERQAWLTESYQTTRNK